MERQREGERKMKVRKRASERKGCQATSHVIDDNERIERRRKKDRGDEKIHVSNGARIPTIWLRLRPAERKDKRKEERGRDSREGGERVYLRIVSP